MSEERRVRNHIGVEVGTGTVASFVDVKDEVRTWGDRRWDNWPGDRGLLSQNWRICVKIDEQTLEGLLPVTKTFLRS